jgi:hypothetical protein
MATSAYMSGRNKYGRPQAMVFSDNPGTLDGGFHVPSGTELEDFIIISDHNRESIQFKNNRIENKVRTVNGRMRSYHIADKLSISTSWKNLPSRALSSVQVFDPLDGQTIIGANDLAYTSDNGAGGVDLLNWYDNHKGSFWLFLAYDKLTNFDTDQYNKLGQYNEVIEVFFDDFQYDVIKRGRSTHDFWDISLSLEEV